MLQLIAFVGLCLATGILVLVWIVFLQEIVQFERWRGGEILVGGISLGILLAVTVGLSYLWAILGAFS